MSFAEWTTTPQLSKSYTNDREIKHDPAKAVKVLVRGYGDWDWFEGMYSWIGWILNNLDVDHSAFDVYSASDCQGNEMWIRFEDPETLFLFVLKAPVYAPK